MSEWSGEGVPHGEEIYSYRADWSGCARYLFVEIINMFFAHSSGVLVAPRYCPKRDNLSI